MDKLDTAEQILRVIGLGTVAADFMTPEQRRLQISKMPLEIRADPHRPTVLWIRLRNGNWLCIETVKSYRITVEAEGPPEFDNE